MIPIRVSKPAKYHNRKTEVDGIEFDSAKEANRYIALRTLERAGKIETLRRQVKIEIAPSVTLDGRRRPSRHYIADFVYEKEGETIHEDCKGMRTDMYRLRRHLVKALHNIEILET